MQGKEETFQFLEAVLKEVMDLFPSEYIHIGGDEVLSHLLGSAASSQIFLVLTRLQKASLVQ